VSIAAGFTACIKVAVVLLKPLLVATFPRIRGTTVVLDLVAWHVALQGLITDS
jgi:hypothetical protein